MIAVIASGAERLLILGRLARDFARLNQVVPGCELQPEHPDDERCGVDVRQAVRRGGERTKLDGVGRIDECGAFRMRIRDAV